MSPLPPSLPLSLPYVFPIRVTVDVSTVCSGIAMESKLLYLASMRLGLVTTFSLIVYLPPVPMTRRPFCGTRTSAKLWPRCRLATLGTFSLWRWGSCFSKFSYWVGVLIKRRFVCVFVRLSVCCSFCHSVETRCLSLVLRMERSDYMTSPPSIPLR